MKTEIKMFTTSVAIKKDNMCFRAIVGCIFALAILIGACSHLPKYNISDTMTLPLREYSTAEYPEDPAGKSVQFGRYADRRLRLVKRDATHFDFILEPMHSSAATVIVKNVDVGLMTPNEPVWVRNDKDLEVIALTDRQWNRQQVSFKRDSGLVDVVGGNGFEKDNLSFVDIAKNCLNAGLWEILLSIQENGQKALYYQGWFTFPLGHYKNIFELNTGTSYWKHWYALEHWSDPAGTPVPLEKLRKVDQEKQIKAEFLADEPIFAYGEQVRKLRTFIAKNLLTWKDFYDEGRSIQFASFVPPGLYKVSKPWKNEYWRLSKFDKVFLRNIRSPASDRPLQELEMVFEDRKTGEVSRLFVSGINVEALPRLEVKDYPKGLYMPMGIGIPPFYQSYEELQQNPPYKSPYFSVLLDSQNRWINHHEVAVDGVSLHRDKENGNLIHLYLLSYERHSLIGHFLITLG